MEILAGFWILFLVVIGCIMLIMISLGSISNEKGINKLGPILGIFFTLCFLLWIFQDCSK